MEIEERFHELEQRHVALKNEYAAVSLEKERHMGKELVIALSSSCNPNSRNLLQHIEKNLQLQGELAEKREEIRLGEVKASELSAELRQVAFT